MENETPQRPSRAKTHGGTALNPFDVRESRVGERGEGVVEVGG